MPIYAYRCASCGHAQDVLQKLSDPVLTVCPACGEPALRKQLTAAGFQLKGSGWYATDFRGGNTAVPKADGDAKDGAKPAEPASGDARAAGAKADAKATDAKTAAEPAVKPAAAAKPAGGGGSPGGAAPAAA